MSQLIHYTNCPVCDSADIKNVLSAKDYTVSNKVFVIAECNACTLRFTQDVPDAASISPYYKSENYISHTNTSKGLINRLYQSVRKRTLKQKRRLIEKATGLTKGFLLDVGSGTGAFAATMKEAGWQVTGLEPDADARTVGKQSYHIELEDINRFFQLQANRYDAITMWHVLEHVHDLKDYIAQLKLLLKENGKLFIAVPNYTSKDAVIYGEQWAAYDVPRHLYHFSPQSMQVLVEKHGLKLLQCKPMWYDSFYVSMLSSKYKNARLNDVVGQGKTNLVASFFNGLRSNMKAMGDVKRCSSVIYIIGK
ncbi:MAG: class I SAM-dependent methyltransferase [Chitinophagaceae bacterium]|nr:class I SAM-dependent methyltransferase [Chitinophagaceae bacterium]MBK7678268.1 class I SAM-dependent methyltransferase [Chitinophagaceae bacterium]MBK8301530.1 class I SAM-dependent methyltransferase [Chitinophagaceae bacterium]MBK9464572.1 class I SAM-dependent methyltransferase [Chitinophagaceae bacterium]MBK9660072.1 class I SAM-dependent methyltransferase [Chitinophagaceae bacterium]